MVDTEEEWEDLVAELTEDWRAENEYRGVMGVKLVEANMADKTVTGHRRRGEECGAAGTGVVERASSDSHHNDNNQAEEGKGAQVQMAEAHPNADVPAQPSSSFDALAVLREGKLELEESIVMSGDSSTGPLSPQVLDADRVEIDMSFSSDQQER